MTVARDIMAGGVRCIGSAESAYDATVMMADLGVGSLPIQGEDNRLKGMITDRDVVVKVIAEGKDPRAIHASELAQGDAVTIGADDDVADLLRAMAVHKVRRLPVVWWSTPSPSNGATMELAAGTSAVPAAMADGLEGVRHAHRRETRAVRPGDVYRARPGPRPTTPDAGTPDAGTPDARTPGTPARARSDASLARPGAADPRSRPVPRPATARHHSVTEPVDPSGRTFLHVSSRSRSPTARRRPGSKRPAHRPECAADRPRCPSRQGRRSWRPARAGSSGSAVAARRPWRLP